MKKTKPVSGQRTKVMAFGVFLLGIAGLWLLLNWQIASKKIESYLTTVKKVVLRKDVVDEMKERHPEYEVITETLVLEQNTGDLPQTYSTDLFSVSYPAAPAYAYNANISDLAGFGFCPGGQQDCQYPRMVIIPMKTTSLAQWFTEDAGYHEQAYWNYHANEGKYAVTVQRLVLGKYPGVILDVSCTEGSDCASVDSKKGAFEANGRVFIFQYDKDTGLANEILQSFTLLEQ